MSNFENVEFFVFIDHNSKSTKSFKIALKKYNLGSRTYIGTYIQTGRLDYYKIVFRKKWNVLKLIRSLLHSKSKNFGGLVKMLPKPFSKFKLNLTSLTWRITSNFKLT